MMLQQTPVNEDTKEISHIWLALALDIYSHCFMGCQSSLCHPDASTFASTLKHAALPKNYAPNYRLHADWKVEGLPEYIIFENEQSFPRVDQIIKITNSLDIKLHFLAQPHCGQIIERHCQEIDKLLETLSSSASVYSDYEEVNRLIVQSIVSHHNQYLHPRAPKQTRFQHWEMGLIDDTSLSYEKEFKLHTLVF